MVEEINETVQVACLFRNGEAKPLKFLWGGREYSVRQVNLAYSRHVGRSKMYFFAVSDETSFFKLQFDSDSFVWTLVEAQFS